MSSELRCLSTQNSVVNTIQLIFATKLDFCICRTNIVTQKIYGSRLKTYGMVILLFWVDNKDGKFRFFEETFLLADINIDVAFGIFFLTWAMSRPISTIESSDRGCISPLWLFILANKWTVLKKTYFQQQLLTQKMRSS